MTELRSGSASHVGRVRSSNQDLSLEAPNLYAVADGMGGHAGGEVAARLAVDTLRSMFSREPSIQGMRQAVNEANAAVWRTSQVQSDLRGMGTTLTAAALVTGTDGHDVVVLANVGDSRAYIYTEGDLSQVTADHSLAEEKVRKGELTEEEAAVHPHRHILTRALGVASDVDVDLWEIHIHAGDRLLLCSDGLTNELEIDEVGDVLRDVPDPQQASDRLVDLANEHGGNDNITVVVVDVVSGADGAGDGAAGGGVLGIVPVPAAAVAAASNGGDTAGDGSSGGNTGAPPAGNAGNGGSPAATQTGTARSSGIDAPTAAVATVSAVALETQAASAPDDPNPTASVTTPDVWDEPVELSDGDLDEDPEGRPESPRPQKPSRRERRRRAGIPRRVTFRVLGFLLLVAGLVVGAYYLVRWYANDSWYVTLQSNQVVIYRGYPGGVLWFQPKVVDKTGVTTNDILFIRIADLHNDPQEPSLSAARNYVNNLVQEKGAQSQIASGGTPGATGTTVIGPTGALPAVTVPPPSTFPQYPAAPSTTTTVPRPASVTTPQAP